MSNTNIQLPLHVDLRRLKHVIGKVVGVKHEVTTHEKQSGSFRNPVRYKEPFDYEKPASETNQWHHDFDDKHVFVSEVPQAGFSQVNLHFVDGANTTWTWLYHAEDKDDDRFKTLAPSSHAMGIAVGIRLVQFFGGNLTFNDNYDEPDLVVEPKRALFPTKKRNQSSNDRWYQFENALRAVPALTSQELLDAAPYAESGVLSVREEALVAHLRAKEKEAALEGALPICIPHPAPKPRF